MLAISPHDSELPRSKNNILKLKNTLTIQPDSEPHIRLEIKASTLAALFAGKQICAADFHCQDHASKLLVQELCLKNCLKQGYCSHSETQEEMVTYVTSLVAR